MCPTKILLRPFLRFLCPTFLSLFHPLTVITPSIPHQCLQNLLTAFLQIEIFIIFRSVLTFSSSFLSFLVLHFLIWFFGFFQLHFAELLESVYFIFVKQDGEEEEDKDRKEEEEEDKDRGYWGLVFYVQGWRVVNGLWPWVSFNSQTSVSCRDEILILKYKNELWMRRRLFILGTLSKWSRYKFLTNLLYTTLIFFF